MVSLDDLERGPWNTKNWHQSLITKKLRFKFPDDMPLGDKKALIAELMTQFPAIAGNQQINVPGVTFSPNWIDDLALFNLASTPYIEFDPRVDTSSTREQKEKAFRTLIKDKKTQAEANKPKENSQQQQSQTTARETLGAFGEGVMEATEAITSIPADVALSRWDDLLKKISQAETFDELAQNVLFWILLLPANAVNDGLGALTGKVDEWTKGIEKKLDAAKKARLDALKKGLNNAKKEADAGDPKKAQELALLTTLMTLDEAGIQRFKDNLASHPELLQNNPDFQKFLQRPDVQDILNGVKKPSAGPHIEITGRYPNYTKNVEMRDGSEYKFTLERSRSGTPPTDTFSYKMKFLMDGKEATLEHDPSGSGKYTVTCDGKKTVYDIATNQVTTTDAGGHVLAISRNPAKDFQAIAKQTEALKKQEEEFAKDLKTLDKPNQLSDYYRDYRTASSRRQREIVQKIKDELGITLNNPGNPAEWGAEIRKARNERHTLTTPPPPKRTGVHNNHPANISHPYTTIDRASVTGFQEFNCKEQMSDGSMGRDGTHAIRNKLNEFFSADIKKFDDGSGEMNIDILKDVTIPSTGGMHGSDPGNLAVKVAYHEDPPGVHQGSISFYQDGKKYYASIKNGQIDKYICYDSRTGNAEEFTLSPLGFSDHELNQANALLYSAPEPGKALDVTAVRGLDMVNMLHQIQTGGTTPRPLRLRPEKQQELNAEIAEQDNILGTRRQKVVDEKNGIHRRENQAHHDDDHGI